jgi:hypothetical protein
MDEQIEETDKSLWTTPVNEMTVGDYVKFNGVVLAATVAVGFAWYGACAASVKISDWKTKRDFRRLDKATESLT